jgi:diguanylate cyclase (GGDEF)-like protein
MQVRKHLWSDRVEECRSAVHLVLVPLLAALSFSPSAQALDPTQRIHHYARSVYTTRDGLPQGSVYAVAQTPDGFLWMGTQEGLVRFDGREFRVFDRSNVPGMRASWVWTLYVDNRGDLWIGTYSGGLLRLSHGRFTAFTEENGLPSNKIRAIAQDSRGALWVGTMGGGLARLEGLSFTVLRSECGLGSNNVFTLLPDRDGGLWIGTHGAGLVHKTDEAWTRYGPSEGLQSDRVLAVIEGSDEELWVGTTAGLASLRDGVLTTYRKADGLPDDVVRSLYRDREGNLWIGTIKGGLARRKAEGFEVLSLADGLPQESVLCLFEDVERNLWVGTNGGGVMALRSGKVSTFTTRDGLAHDISKALLVDHLDRVWIGSTAGIARLDDGAPAAFPGQVELRGETINALAERKNGAVWVATQGSGLFVLDSARASRVEEPKELVDLKSFSLLEDRERSLWIGTQGQGLLRLRGDAVTVYGEHEGLVADVIWRLFEDRAGQLWVGTSQGLYRRTGDRFSRIDVGADPYNNTVLSFYEAGDGAVWIGTMGGGIGLVRGQEIRAVRKEDGLHDDAAFELLPDGLGNLWITSNKGLVSVNYDSLLSVALGERQRLEIEVLGLHDGLVSAECNGGVHSSGVKTKDGRLWFATMGGVAMIDPGRLPSNDVAPSIHLEKLVVDNREQPLGPAVVLAPESEKLELWYTAPSFVAPQHVTCEYRLDGLDDTWVEARERRVAYYSNLRAGDYVFRVRSRSAAGVQSTMEATVRLRKEPFFYQTIWFAALVVSVCLGLVLLVFRVRVAAVAARNVELVRLVAQRTEELRAANAALKEQSLRDPLTQLRNRRYLHEILVNEVSAFARALAHSGNSVERRGQTAGDAYGILVLDIDHFKRVNDIHGHLVGDVLLQSVAQVLMANVRAEDVVIRWGGEEFLVLLRHIDHAAAVAKAEVVRRQVAAAKTDVGGGEALSVSVSIGVTAYPFYTTEPLSIGFEQCIGIADQGLLRAKQDGRDRTVAVQPLRPPRSPDERERLVHSLEEAESGGLVRATVVHSAAFASSRGG